MDQDQQPLTPLRNIEGSPSDPLTPTSEDPRPVSEPLGNDAETSGSNSEDDRNEQVPPSEKPTEFPKMKERRSDHNTTVRTAAKTLEAAGYPITERTIINWCRPAKDGSAKLDCAFDDKEKKYFITRESLELVMVDLPKAEPPQPLSNFPKGFGKIPKVIPNFRTKKAIIRNMLRKFQKLKTALPKRGHQKMKTNFDNSEEKLWSRNIRSLDKTKWLSNYRREWTS